LLLCGNGYGISAEKLLRGMFERAVTLAYLHEHPSEEEKFRNYGKVSQHKLLKIVEESLGTNAGDHDSSDAMVAKNKPAKFVLKETS
jgi:hypothetical protein